MSSLFGPGVMFLFFLFVAALVFLYVMSILWAKKDAKARGANEKSAMLISLIPFAGVLAYVLMRPPLLKIDEEEQNLDIKLKTRQLKKYDVCPSCGADIEYDFIVCPNCGHKLKELCTSCKKPLDPKWNNCPYCGVMVKNINEEKTHNEAPKAEPKVKVEPQVKAEPQVDYKVEDSFSFDEDTVEEVSIDLDNDIKPKHLNSKVNNSNTHK